jgi:hypothetical protein
MSEVAESRPLHESLKKEGFWCLSGMRFAPIERDVEAAGDRNSPIFVNDEVIG